MARWYISFSLMMMALMSGPVFAACTLASAATAGTLSVSFGNITVDPGTTTASVLDSQTFDSSASASAMGISNTDTLVTCSGAESLVWGNSAYTAISGTSTHGFLKTGIDNLYLYFATDGGTLSGLYYPTSSAGNATVAVSDINSGAPRWLDIGSMTVSLYQNGRITQGGTVSGGLLSSWQTSDSVSLLNVYLNGFTVTVPSCTASTSTVNVALGTVNKSQFSGAGSTAGETDFDVVLNCQSGITPAVTFTGTADSSGATGVLALNEASDTTVATGVGVQLLYNNSPVALGSAINLGTTTAEGDVTLSMQARYYQTASTITAGQANSTAYYTVSYE